MQKINLKQVSFISAKKILLKRSNSSQSPLIKKTVQKIISDVKKNGNKALIRQSNKIDKTNFKSISDATYSRSDFEKHFEKLDKKTKKSLEYIKKRIIKFHKSIKINDLKFSDEIFNFLGQIHKPIEKIGLYAPGGKAVYPSSILMTALVARVAGCKEVSLFFPSSSDEAKKLMLATAHVSEINHAYNFGGAQAIAAMAYGTETIIKSDKIFGPGNIFVSEA